MRKRLLACWLLHAARAWLASNVIPRVVRCGTVQDDAQTVLPLPLPPADVEAIKVCVRTHACMHTRTRVPVHASVPAPCASHSSLQHARRMHMCRCCRAVRCMQAWEAAVEDEVDQDALDKQKYGDTAGDIKGKVRTGWSCPQVRLALAI